MFLNTQMIAQNIAPVSVCLTPIPSPAGPIPTPIPYPNMAQTAMAIPNVLKHFVQMMPVHNLATMIPMTMGDNAGVMGGVMSGTFMGPSRHLMGSMKVLSMGLPVTKMLSPTMQNLINAPGMTSTPSQVKVLVMS